MKRRMFIPILMLSLLAGSSAPILSAEAKTPKDAPVAISEYRLKFNKSLGFSLDTATIGYADAFIEGINLVNDICFLSVDATNGYIGSINVFIEFTLEDSTISYASTPYTDFSFGFGLYDFSAYNDILGGETLVPTVSVLYTDYSVGFDAGASSQAEVDASSYTVGISDAYSSGYDDGSNQTGIVINDGFLCIAAVVLFAFGCFFAWRTETNWLFAVSGLLWFVPIFLMSNLFIIIFSIVMIVFSFMLTFLKA